LKGKTMRKMMIAATGLGMLAGVAGMMLVADRPATAQVFSNGSTIVSAATAGNGATDMWAIDPRTNQVIYCRGAGAAPSCRSVLMPGAAQPVDKLPR
jgi:hypothetical protein